MSFSNLAIGNGPYSLSLSDGFFFPSNFGQFPHTRALIPTLLNALGGPSAGVWVPLLCCSVLQSPVILMSSNPQLSLLISVSLLGRSPSLHCSLGRKVSQGRKQDSRRAHLFSFFSLRGPSSSLPCIQCCDNHWWRRRTLEPDLLKSLLCHFLAMWPRPS